jgi:hypothetical protein
MTITSNGTTYTGNVEFAGAVTYTLADNMSVSGAITFNSTGTITVNNNTLFIEGNLTHTNSGIVTGTTTFIFNGTGTWSHTSTGVIRNNTTINTTGTLTIGTNIRYDSGTLTYIAGTVVTTGSTLFFQQSPTTTLNTNGIIWNNITPATSSAIILTSNLTLTGTLTVSNTTLSFTLNGNSLVSTNANLTMGVSGTFTLPANQTFKTLTVSGGANINSNILTITENLTINASLSGTSSIVYGGTGTWTAIQYINNNFTINTAGTLTISGTVYKGANTITYTAGTIDDTNGTLVIGISGITTVNISGYTWTKLLVAGGITLTSNINATTFGTALNNNISFTLNGNSLNFTHLELGHVSTLSLPTAWTCTNIEFKNTGTQTLNGFSITINGNILQSGNVATQGTTTFTYAGTGTWTALANGYFSNSFTINTAGTLTFISANIGGGIFTYTAGTVITTGSILTIRGSATTMNHGAIIWYDVTTITNVISFILNNQLVCLNALTIDNSQVTFSGIDGTFDVYYLNLNSSGTVARNPRLVATKTYRVRAGFTSQGTFAFPITLTSTVAASQAIFTVDPGATIDVGFVNATDIDSSLVKTIYSYKGVLTNSLNWALLPTDVVAGVGVSNSVFVN